MEERSLKKDILKDSEELEGISKASSKRRKEGQR